MKLRQYQSAQPKLAEALTREMGKPYKESMDEIGWTISAFDYYAEIGRHELGRIYAPSMSGQLHCSIKEPLGVAVLIMPYNYPLLLFAWQAAAAIAAGNAVIVKPSEITSLTTLLMMEVFAPLPKGLGAVRDRRAEGRDAIARKHGHALRRIHGHRRDRPDRRADCAASASSRC